jgi:hypothetical protein
MASSEFDEFMSSRYDDQLKWYSEKSRWNKKMHIVTKICILVASGIVTLLAGLSSSQSLTSLVIFIFSLLVVIIESVSLTYRFHDNWLNYRTTAEALKKEVVFFKTRAGPYQASGPDAAEQRFVDRVEELISRENKVWRLVSEETTPRKNER